MSLLITLFLAFAAHANELIEIKKLTPVYKKPALDSTVYFNLQPKEMIEVSKSTVPEYLQIKLIRKGRAYQGFVFRRDVVKTEKIPTEESSRNYGFGGGVEYTYLTQKGKSFATEDNVQYSTSSYISSMANPFLVAQYQDENFWRLTLAYKKTHFTGTAATNVASSSQEVELNHTFYSVLLQRAWTPESIKWCYFGAGLELAKAVAVQLKKGGTTLATSSNEQPLYIGPMAFTGISFEIDRSLTLFVEARFEYIANQSPSVLGLEGALGVLYWP